jgi:phage major head subunit gpT-like protein
MGVANNPAANRIFQEFDTEFIRMLDKSPNVWREFGMEVPSTSRSTLHAWLIDEAQVREWKGGRILNEMGDITWEVVNRNWEISWKFFENQIRDDLSGLVALAIQKARSYAAKWIRHENKLAATTVQQGVSRACYDGQNFFSTTHPNDPLALVPGTFPNLRTAKPLNHANVMSGLVQLRSIIQPDGSPWVGPEMPIKLVVEASNEFVADQIATTQWLTPATAFALSGTTGPSENPLRGKVTPIVNQYMNNEPGVWYLSAEADGLQPIMLQRRQGVESQEQGPGSQLYFDRKQYSIGQDARYECSYTHPQLMQRNEPT